MKGKWIILLLLLLIPACSRPVAEVNGKPISKKAYLRELKERKLAIGNQVDELTIKNIVIDSLIEESLILEEAKAKNIKATQEEVQNRLRALRQSFKTEEDFKKYLRNLGYNEDEFKRRLEEKVVIDKFIVSMADIFSVTLDEVKREYELNRPLLEPEMVKVSMIEVTEKGLAEDIYERIKKGSFEEVVKGLRRDEKSRENVIITEPQWVRLSVFSPELQDLLRKSKKGLVGPYERRSSWYIIKIYDKKPPRFKPFDEAKTEIMFALLHKKRLSALQDWLRRKKENSKIVIYAERL